MMGVYLIEGELAVEQFGHGAEQQLLLFILLLAGGLVVGVAVVRIPSP